MAHQHHLLLGAHISISGGFYAAISRGQAIGCTAIQIFTKSNQQWAAKSITQEQIDRFLTTWQNSTVKSVIAHASYLINIGSPSEKTLAQSRASLQNELQRCDLLEIPHLVLHPGNHLQTDELSCLQRIANTINTIFDAHDSKTMLLLETMAGQGSNVGHSLEQIATIIDLVENKKRIGVCIDTCHLFAAGYDFRTPENYQLFWHQFDEFIGLSKLKAIHLNDSKKECNSRVDRHEHIGKGKIGLQPFELLMNDPRFFDVPKIIETPKVDFFKEDAMNLATLKSLIWPETKKILSMND